MYFNITDIIGKLVNIGRWYNFPLGTKTDFFKHSSVFSTYNIIYLVAINMSQIQKMLHM